MHTALSEEEFITYISELTDEQLERMYQTGYDELSDTEILAMGAERLRRGLEDDPYADYEREEMSKIISPKR